MKNEISIGDLVEVYLNTESDAFQGTVLDLNETMDFDGSAWYKVQPSKKNDMPGNFWYRANKVKKVAK